MTGIDDLAQVLEALHDLVHWQFLGLELGIPYGRLTYFKHNNSGNTQNCKRDMLTFWLMRDHNIMMGIPSWSILKAALRNIGENELADTIPTDGESECHIYTVHLLPEKLETNCVSGVCLLQAAM